MNNELALNDFNAELLPERNTMFALIGSPVFITSTSAESVQALTFLSSSKAVAVTNNTVYYHL